MADPVPSLDHLKQAYAVTARATQATPLLSGKIDVNGKTALVIVTGGNVSLSDFMKHVADA
jgi:hypothetical protein